VPVNPTINQIYGTNYGSGIVRASAQPLAKSNPHALHVTPRRPPGGGAPIISGPMYDFGGPVESAPVVYVDYWGWTSDPSGEAAYLNRFLSAVGGTPWLNTVTQYGGGNPSGFFGGSWFDPAAIPAQPTDGQLQYEAAKAAQHFGLGTSVNIQVVVATPTGHWPAGFDGYCAWHNRVASAPNITYTSLPYLPDAPTGCGGYSVNPAPDGKLDGVSIVEGHELAETITDPLPLSGWHDASDNEIGDKCEWSNLADIRTSNGTFAMQPLWSNSDNGCVMFYPHKQPLDHLVLSPSTATVAAGAAQTYSATGFDALGNSLGDVTAATTFTISPNGAGSGASCDNTAKTCTATRPDAYTVTGTDSGKAGSATLHVIAAPLDHLRLSPSTATVAAGAAQTYSATGFDALGNSLGDVTAATTFTISPNWPGSGASCDNTAKTCTATSAGTYTVTGTDSGQTGRATLTILNPPPPQASFTLRPGRGTNIGVGANGSVWVVGTNPVAGGYGIYRWNTAWWTPVPGGALRMAVDPSGNPWVVNSAGQIYHWVGNGWVLYPGAAIDIGVGANGSVWVIGTNPVAGGYGIYYWNGGGWTPVPGGALRIAVDPNGNPWVVNSAGKIYHWVGNGWVLYPGAAIDIGVGANGSVWVIGTNPVAGGYGIYYWNGGAWTPVAGGADGIDVGPDGNPWVVNSANQIYSS
jgi:hypothetical protein